MQYCKTLLLISLQNTVYYIINIVFNIQYLTCSITNNINSNYLSLLIVSLPTQSFNNLLPPFPGQKVAFKCPTQAHMLNESLCDQGKLLNLKKFLMLLFGFFGGSIILQSDNFPLCQSLTKANSVFTFKCLVYSTDLNFHPTQQWFKFTTSGAQATDKSPEFAQRGLLKLQINPPLIYMWPLIIIGFSETTITYYSFL